MSKKYTLDEKDLSLMLVNFYDHMGEVKKVIKNKKPNNFQLIYASVAFILKSDLLDKMYHDCPKDVSEAYEKNREKILEDVMNTLKKN